MAYRCNDTSVKQKIKSYIDSYICDNYQSPSMREIAMGTGISLATVQRYMNAMRTLGELEYKRRDIRTELSEKIDRDRVVVGKCGRVSCGAPREPMVEADEFFSVPKKWVGEGTFYILEADGDSMVDAGIDCGDLVIVRQQSYADDGDIAVVLVDGCETTLKRFYREPSMRAFRLHAENSSYGGEMRDRIVKNAEIQGVAVKVVKNLK